MPAEIRVYNQLFATRSPTPPISPPTSIRSRWKSVGTHGRARDCRRQCRGAVQFERQGYFVRDQDSTPASSCSTAPSACATPLPRLPQPADAGFLRYSVSVPLFAVHPLPVASRRGREGWPDGGAGQGSGRTGGYAGRGRRAGCPCEPLTISFRHLAGARCPAASLARAEAGAGRLLPWVPVAFGTGIAFYFAADHEPVPGSLPQLRSCFAPRRCCCGGKSSFPSR